MSKEMPPFVERRRPPPPSTALKIYRWAVGISLGALISFFGLRENYIFSRLDKFDERLGELEKGYRDRGEKIDRIYSDLIILDVTLKERTAKFEAIIANQDRILKALERLEKKDRP